MKNNDKALVLRRLCIFLVLAFVPSILLQIWGGKDGTMGKAILGISLMHTPLIANLLTRLITHEGMEESYLKVNARGNMKFYVLAVILPLVNGIVGGLIINARYGGEMGLADNLSAMGASGAIASFTMTFWAAGGQIFQGFGEEAGWRGYLTPKLEKLMPTPAALVVSGILWGLWHGPLVWNGYNFGTEHPGWVNLGMMCVSCIIMGVGLTMLTKMTGSVWSAALCHSVIDSAMSLPLIMLCDENVLADHHFSTMVIAMTAAPAVVIAAAAVIVLALRKKPAPAQG